MSRPLILYHANCMDGFCAAWCAWRKFGDSADYIPVQYSQDPPDVVGREVFILDFSYRAPVLIAMVEAATKITVLDHHKTAEADLAAVKSWASWASEEVQGYDCKFDLNKSGGRLAWEYFFPEKVSPWRVDYTEDRDLWRWQLQDSREISAFIASHPFDFKLCDNWLITSPHAGQTGLWTRFVAEGAAILRYQAQLITSICSVAREIEIDGHKVLAANTSCLHSEVAGALAQGKPFGATWFIRADGKKQWSVRCATDRGVDVSEIAKRRGNGGHRNAAGWVEQ